MTGGSFFRAFGRRGLLAGFLVGVFFAAMLLCPDAS